MTKHPLGPWYFQGGQIGRGLEPGQRGLFQRFNVIQ
jgi:hypothetical protein